MGKIIDVSEAQGKIDWAKVAPEVDFVILRASEGQTVDIRFYDNAEQCLKFGIPFGVYHYMHCMSESAALAEVKTFYNCAKKYRPSFWVMDVESPSLLFANRKSLPMNAWFRGRVAYFYDELRKRVGSAAHIIYYGGESIYEPYGHLSSIAWDGLWIANYGKNTGQVSGVPKMPHDLHQYTSKGKCAGISTNVDLSRMVGTKDLAWWTGRGEKPDEEIPFSDVNGDGLIVKIYEPTAWNIRELPDATSRLTGYVAQYGEDYEYAATAWNDWLGVFLPDGSIGWISPKGAKVVNA